MNFQKYIGIFSNMYTACFLMLLAMQKLSTSAEINYSDHFYLIERDAWKYKETCLVVNKSNILKNGIFTPINGSSCKVEQVSNGTYWSKIVIEQPKGIPEIGLKGYFSISPEPKLIYRMDKSFIFDVFRSHDNLAGIYAMNNKTIGSLFAKLLLDHYGNSSYLNYMAMQNYSDSGFIRFLLRIESNDNNIRYGAITLMNSTTNLWHPKELYLNHFEDFNDTHDILLVHGIQLQFKYFFSKKSCFGAKSEMSVCSDKEKAMREFENLKINFARTDIQSIKKGSGELNVTVTKNDTTKEYLAIFRANYEQNVENKIFHFRKIFTPTKNPLEIVMNSGVLRIKEETRSDLFDAVANFSDSEKVVTFKNFTISKKLSIAVVNQDCVKIDNLLRCKRDFGHIIKVSDDALEYASRFVQKCHEVLVSLENPDSTIGVFKHGEISHKTISSGNDSLLVFFDSEVEEYYEPIFTYTVNYTDFQAAQRKKNQICVALLLTVIILIIVIGVIAALIASICKNKKQPTNNNNISEPGRNDYDFHES